MGRKKRAAVQQEQQTSTLAAPLPPVALFDQYGRPMPPPPITITIMPQQQQDNNNDTTGPAAKRSRAPIIPGGAGDSLPDGERQNYPVKKYRPDTYYRSIEAFSRYTKAHRMLDASYVRWTTGGGSPEKPIVFGIRIAGSFLSWGRGKTRDAAIDAAIRAAFALVAAHGYDDFTFTEDCFTEEPFSNNGNTNSLAPMPPPPPPPPNMMMHGGMMIPPPLPPGLPPAPLPHGMPPNFTAPPPAMIGVPPPNFAMPPPPLAEDMIPQPSAPNAHLAVASTVVEGFDAPAKMVGLLTPATAKVSTVPNHETTKNGSNNGLVFAGEDVDEHGEELSMGEMRMQVPRYWSLIIRALAKTIEQ